VGAAGGLIIDGHDLSTAIFAGEAGEASAAEAIAGEPNNSASVSAPAPIVYRTRPIVELHPYRLSKTADHVAFCRLRSD
jgi:hypothetical protein